MRAHLMIDCDKKYVIIGKFGRAHGILGELRLYSYTTQWQDIDKYNSWYLKIDSDYKLIKREQVRFGSDHLLVKLAKVNSREETFQYTNKEIAILRQQLPKLGHNEYYWTDIEGLDVFNKEDKLGRVEYLFETDAADIMVVLGEEQLLIPFILDKIILKVDLVAKNIFVNLDNFTQSIR